MLASSSYSVEQHVETVCITVKVFFVVEKRPEPTTGTPHPGWTAHPLINVCIDRRSWTKYRHAHTHTCVRNRTWSNCRHNPHKVEHLHSHLTGRTKQSNFHIKAVEHAHSILDCLRLQNIEKATCLGRTLTQT